MQYLSDILYNKFGFSFSEIKITTYSYAVYHAFLRYLYSDKVELPPEEAIGKCLYVVHGSYHPASRTL